MDFRNATLAMVIDRVEECARLTDRNSWFASVIPFARPAQVEKIGLQATQKDLRGEARIVEGKEQRGKSPLRFALSSLPVSTLRRNRSSATKHMSLFSVAC
jgi:hypothetical protein